MDGNYKIFNDLSKIGSRSNKSLYVSLILTFVSHYPQYLLYLQDERERQKQFLSAR